MKKNWSKSWKNSTQPRKQRKYRANAPMHVRKKFVSVHLDESLRKKYGIRSFPLRKGDEVKIMRGGRKDSKAKVERIDLERPRIYLEGQAVESSTGGKTLIPFRPSNLMITNIGSSDKKRENILSRKSGKKIILEKKKDKKKSEKKPETKEEKKSENKSKEEEKKSETKEEKKSEKKEDKKETTSKSKEEKK